MGTPSLNVGAIAHGLAFAPMGTITSRRGARRALALGAALLLAGLSVACSDSSSSGSRGAAGATAVSANACDTSKPAPATSSTTSTTVVSPSGTPCEQVNVNEFCKTPSFTWVGNITTCFQLVDNTKKFSAPDTLDSRFELTIPYATCGPSNPPTPCRESYGYRGIPRDENLGNTYGRRTLRPNPFASTGYIQFQPDSIWQGAHVRLFVGSQQSPFSLSQALPQPDFENTYSGTNGGNCDTQGQYISCALDNSSWSRDGRIQNPKFTLGTKPLRIRVSNSIGSATVSLKLINSQEGSGLLIDPIAVSGIDQIAKGQIGLTGGYRQVAGDGSRGWTATYCVTDGSPVCTEINISVAYSIKDGAIVNDSTCNVTNRSASKTYICDKPVLTGSDEDLIASINVKDF